MCQPENQNHNTEDKCWFYVVLFYLYKNGYFIEEFPRIIERPPADSYDFVYKDIRNKLLADGKDAEIELEHMNICFEQNDISNYDLEHGSAYRIFVFDKDVNKLWDFIKRYLKR